MEWKLLANIYANKAYFKNKSTTKTKIRHFEEL